MYLDETFHGNLEVNCPKCRKNYKIKCSFDDDISKLPRESQVTLSLVSGEIALVKKIYWSWVVANLNGEETKWRGNIFGKIIPHYNISFTFQSFQARAKQLVSAGGFNFNETVELPDGTSFKWSKEFYGSLNREIASTAFILCEFDQLPEEKRYCEGCISAEIERQRKMPKHGKRCPSCHKTVEDDINFCPDCGKQTRYVKYCNHCNEKVLTKFCPKCGEQILF